MKIQSTTNGASITINRRGTGDGLVINQGRAFILLNRAEWRELAEIANKLLTADTHPSGSA